MDFVNIYTMKTTQMGYMASLAQPTTMKI